MLEKGNELDCNHIKIPQYSLQLQDPKFFQSSLQKMSRTITDKMEPTEKELKHLFLYWVS